MKFIYFDAVAGMSGDMILGALLDLGVPHKLFKDKMADLKLPVEIHIKETKRSSLRALKVDVEVRRNQSVTRKWNDIENLIGNASLNPDVKGMSLAIFRKLFEAESHVHGHKFEKTHLHEAGADDAIIDIVGCSFLLNHLNIGSFYASPLNVGRGWVKTSHGILPVPPPAVAELLKGIPAYSAWVKQELVTPTGAAIAATLIEKFLPFPEICYERIGCGAGNRDFPDFPNILRVFFGKKEEFHEEKDIYQIETNIDDSTPQVLAHFYDRAFSLGALDVFISPILMKKNRQAVKLTVLAELGKMDSLVKAIFKETSSIGIRYFPVGRRTLERKTVFIELMGDEIPVKIAYLEGEEVNVQPEYAECLKAAEKHNTPVKKIMEMVRSEYYRKDKIKRKV
ncbi:MAG: nickel pincer cofactor biosynthesis protein LarC [Candidatus Aminicenantes bacterium]|nr:nickel pincer cofactor biosynthesis protein LarC [Candidatus Aminicenantes bacterium]